MQLDRYELIASDSLTRYEFWSIGKKGKILKIVLFELTPMPDTYNLAFGDANLVTVYIDDLTVSDNGNMDKVLATVVFVVYAFTNQYPNIWVYATGSAPSRTRLYQMGINKYFNAILSDFHLIGNRNGQWEWYKKGKSYQALAAKKKRDKFEL